MLKLKTLYVFVDESGNFDFSDSGTKHLVLSAVICHKPLKSSSNLLKLKYLRLALGFNTPGFHASQDRPNTRHQVLSTISRDKSLRAFTLVLDKRCHPRVAPSPSRIYHAFGIALATNLKAEVRRKKVILIFDKALKAKEEASLFASLKSELASFEGEYLIYFQNVSKDLNAQIADYVAWANFVAFERGNRNWLNYLPPGLNKSRVLDIRP